MQLTKTQFSDPRKTRVYQLVLKFREEIYNGYFWNAKEKEVIKQRKKGEVGSGSVLK